MPFSALERYQAAREAEKKRSPVSPGTWNARRTIDKAQKNTRTGPIRGIHALEPENPRFNLGPPPSSPPPPPPRRNNSTVRKRKRTNNRTNNNRPNKKKSKTKEKMSKYACNIKKGKFEGRRGSSLFGNCIYGGKRRRTFKKSLSKGRRRRRRKRTNKRRRRRRR